MCGIRCCGRSRRPLDAGLRISTPGPSPIRLTAVNEGLSLPVGLSVGQPVYCFCSPPVSSTISASNSGRTTRASALSSFRNANRIAIAASMLNATGSDDCGQMSRVRSQQLGASSSEGNESPSRLL